LGRVESVCASAEPKRASVRQIKSRIGDVFMGCSFNQSEARLSVAVLGDLSFYIESSLL
jgi:hypothetical protein